MPAWLDAITGASEMTTQFSCGHWATDSEDIGVPVSLKTQGIDEYNGGYMNVIHYATYCNDCYKQAVEVGCVAMTDEEEMNWLRGEIK